LPLLRRMKHLEKLTLDLHIDKRSLFVDGTHINNEILVHMPQLHTFIFYISTEMNIDNLTNRKSISDIQQTFTNIKYGETDCIVDYFHQYQAICQVFSLPFTFTHMENISNRFPTIVFDTVTYLSVYDTIPMKHEFFMRISQAFTILKYLVVKNEMMQSLDHNEWKSDENSSYSVIEYSHLISLDVSRANLDYIVQFLLETKTHLPCLTTLKVDFDELTTATMDFTRDAMRRNCSKVKQLIPRMGRRCIPLGADRYFPAL